MSSDMNYLFKTQRRAAISQHPTQIGIDYVEYVDGPQLKLYFIPAAEGVTKEVRPTISTANISIQSESGLEQSYIRATAVNPAADADNVLEVSLEYDDEAPSGSGELPIYMLELLNVPHLDPFFASVDFTLQVDEPSQLDPQAVPVQETAPQLAPEIDYLAKDYSSFRQLMLNRLSLLIPSWQERNPADLGQALVEVLAYVGDYASYYQDAVATEAYLHTARQRVSIRRHARLIDYTMHEGCNARVWVQVQVNDNDNETTLPVGTQLLTQVNGLVGPVLDDPTYQQALIQGATVFETMHEKSLSEEQNKIDFYTWGAREFLLPEGSTSATLRGHLSSLEVGQVLIFEEVRGTTTGEQADADPTHRHAVRLTDVKNDQEDPLGGFFSTPPSNSSIPITEITWHDEDALPFDLQISNKLNSYPAQISVARGNIVLADHGFTIQDDALIPATVPAFGRYRPRLPRPNLTYAVSYDKRTVQDVSAAALFRQMPQDATPVITLLETENENENQNGNQNGNQNQTWQALPDLLDSDRFTLAFVVEMESDRQAILRFGDGTQGKQPLAGTVFRATYRVGNGLAGNVGREAIAYLYTKDEDEDEALTGNVTKVCNWLPAEGGIDPEPISEVRLYAPTAFQTQERCVTEEDYVTITKRHPEVEDAAAMLRWTGSWYTAVVIVKRSENRPVDTAFQDAMLAYLQPYRVAGYDITIRAPRFVSLDIALTVYVETTYFASTVKQTLLETFSDVDLPNGQRGFFYPDNWTFGQPVYLSQIISTAVNVHGVLRVVSTLFKRWGRPAQAELETGLLPITPLEIAQVQNDPDAPQRGRIVFTMEGGRK